MSGGTDSLAIDLQGLRKVYRKGRRGVVAVDGLDLRVHRGEVFGLLGPNGAGKTTTVEICEGLLDPTDGAVLVVGRSWQAGEGREIRARIGVCLQQTQFFEKQTVREILELFAAFFPRGRSVGEVIDLVSLGEKSETRTAQLSGGQRQRLAVATALLGDPELLFLDEPTTGLDPQSRRQLWDVVRDYRAAGGTVLITTHYMEEAAQLCDRVAIVDHGRRIALGTPAELVRSLGGEHLVEVDAPGLADRVGIQELERLPSIHHGTAVGDRLSLAVHHIHAALPALLDLLRERGVEMENLTTRQATLEDVFVELTGRHLRDGGGE